MIDPYTALGISKTATEKDIRSAYRRLAKQYHPDHNPGDTKAEERFKEVGKAYAILGDKEQRARFDRGEIDANGQERGFPGGGFANGGFGGGPFGGGGFQGEFHGGAEDLGDVFSGMFGGGGLGAGRPRRGQDVQGEVRITFLESVLGTQREMQAVGGSPVNVTIPPGAENGQTLRLRGRGMPGQPGRDGTSGPAGDMLLKITVIPDARYVREGRNLRVTQDIDLKTAVLGGKVHVNTPKGTVALTIKPHSDSGMVLRIPGRGVAAHGRHAVGDMLVTLRVMLGEVDPALEAFLKDQDSQK